MIRLLLVDDQDLFRQGLAALLTAEADLEVIGQAQNGQEAIALTIQLQPDVILMDVQMPICDGIMATHEILKRTPSARIIVLTTFDNDEYIVQSMQAGALGYLLKHTPADEFAATIRSAYRGYTQLGPTIAPKVFSHLKPMGPMPQVNYQQLLSKREIEVLKLIGQGKTNQEIAQELYITEGTVKNYVTRILSQLEMRDRIQAVIWTQQHLF